MIIRLLVYTAVFSLGTMSFAQTTAPHPMATAMPFHPPDVIPPGIIVPVWPEGKMPGLGADLPESQNIPQHHGLLKITNVSNPTLEIFKAPNATGPVPAMIICPGGGYGLLAYNYEGTEAAAWLNSLGITGIVLKYRVPKNREGAYQDMERALRLTRQHATEWGIRSDKLGVLGFSAGGHLAARLSNNFNNAAYPEIDAADKLSCRPDFVILVYPGYLEAHHVIAPEMTVTSSTPETLTVITEDDPTHILGCRIYDAALAAANVPHELLVYPTGGHGFGLRTNGAAKVWPTDAAAWLRKIGVL